MDFASLMNVDSVAAIFNIFFVNIILSGDNAIVIALASRGLPEQQRRLATLWGSGFAVVLRVGLTMVVAFLLRYKMINLFGGILLVWIAVKLLTDKEEEVSEGGAVVSQSRLADAVKTIIFADVIMSLDNTLAIAAVAKGDMVLLTVGLVLSVPLIVFGSQLLSFVMAKWPAVVYVGAGLIAWTAGEMIFPVIPPEHLDVVIPGMVVVFVITVGFLINMPRVSSEEIKDFIFKVIYGS